MKISKNKIDEFLFVYGTLRKAFDNKILLSVSDNLQYVGIGYLKGVLYDLGEYPGMVIDKNGELVKGEIYKIDENRNLVFQLLDEYEGYYKNEKKQSEFLRKKTTIRLRNGGQIDSWVYSFNYHTKDHLKKISTGDYIRYLRNDAQNSYKQNKS